MRNPTLALVALALAVAVAAPAAPPTANPGDFYLSLGAPPGWQAVGPDRLPQRLHGTLLAGWQKLTDADRAVIYVVAIRRAGAFTLAQVSNDFRRFLTDSKVVFTPEGDLALAGRGAVKFTFTAPGNGQIIKALNPEVKQSLSTYMEIIIIANPWSDGKGTDLLHFVFAAPAADKEAMRPAFKSLINTALVKDRHNPAAGGGQTDDALGDDNLVASGEIIPGRPPVLKPGPMMPQGEAPMQTGMGLPPDVTFLVAVDAGQGPLWVCPQHQSKGWYVLVCPTKRAAYILTADEYKQVTSSAQGLLVLPWADTLEQHLNRWDKLWPVPVAPPDK